MSEGGIFVIACFLLIFLLGFKAINSLEKQNDLLLEEWDKGRELWIKERQQLLDRIQAPSFAEYKQAEVKVIKAQKDEPPVERIELL